MNSLDETILTLAKHKGLKELQDTLKNDLRTALEEPEQEFCICEQPDFETDDSLNWFCVNCNKPANYPEPEYDDDGEEVTSYLI